MTPEQFCYWLQGFVELSGQPPTEEQWVSINNHLKTVFRKVTPPTPFPVLPTYPVPWTKDTTYPADTIIC